MTWLTALLGAAAAVLVGAAVSTARRPAHPLPDRAGYFVVWAQLHGGYDPQTGSRLLRGWLSMVFYLSRPLARRGLSPDLLTVSSIWLAVAVVVPVLAGDRWLLAAGLIVVASGLFDSLDGCVAVLQGRATAWGYVLDSVVDRVTDCIYLVALTLVGAPVSLAVGCGFLFFLLEYLRARAGNAGGDPVGRITVGERPNRVIFQAAALLLGGVLPAYRRWAASGGLWLLAVLTAVAVLQLAVAVRRQLLAPPAPVLPPAAAGAAAGP